MKILKDESGQALFIVMMVIMVLVLTGAASLTRTSGSRMRSFEEKKMVQASYIAEAGVEKALANIKSNYLWLKGLEYNTETNYITALAYAGGEIASVKLKRTSTGNNPTTFFIESRGDYQGATRTIKVTGEMYDPIDFARGVWVKSDSVFSNNTIYYSNVTAQGDLQFDNNVIASGDVLVTGSLTLRNNMNANRIKAGEDIHIYNNVKVNEGVIAGRDIIIEQNGGIDGYAKAIRNVTLYNNAEINGDLYYNGTLVNNNGTINGDIHYPWGITSLDIDIPPFPVVEESLYDQFPNIAPSGTLSGSFNVDGIHYVPGNLDIEGTYYGKGIIVTHGKVSITGNLMRASGDKQSSLAIIAFGKDANGIGISSVNQSSVTALLYSPYKISLENKFQFFGSLVCDQVKVDNNAVVTYDATLHDNQPKWMTTVVKIKSWKEAYPVF